MKPTLSGEDGQIVVEYAVIGILVSVVAIAVIQLIGGAVTGMFSDVLDAF